MEAGMVSAGDEKMNRIDVLAEDKNGNQITGFTYGPVSVGAWEIVFSHDCNGLNFSGRYKIIEIL